MILRRQAILNILFFLSGCSVFTKSRQISGRLTIGVVSYDEGLNLLTQFQGFNDYLSQELQTNLELEPAYNEVQALEQINRQRWSLVFAPPGLAAIAIYKANYIPLFPLQGQDSLNSILVVQDTSPLKVLPDLMNQPLALGQRGSVSAYYMPLYDLYGLTLQSIKLAETPEEALQWVTKGEVAVAAMGKEDFDRAQSKIPNRKFRILHRSRRIPSGSILLSPTIERNQQRQIEQALNMAAPAIAASVGYIPNAKPPDYKQLMEFIDKVKPIENHLQSVPAPLFN
jgi:phosphonate transport system substrate-binding protein